MGGSRLLISYGQQRPRLESVSLSQWVVANTRIFHSLLFSCKLPTSRDVRDYLAYTVKIMELAGKYEWTSVLKFDDEFCQLQATYSFPWSHGSTHLHQITLVPKAKPKQNTSTQPSSSNQSFVGPNTAVYSADNKVICRNLIRQAVPTTRATLPMFVVGRLRARPVATPTQQLSMVLQGLPLGDSQRGWGCPPP